MDVTKFTREQLAEYILTSAKDTVIEKIKSIVDKEGKEDIVAYTTNEIPLNVIQYKAEIQKGIDDIAKGKVISDEDLTKEIATW